MIPNQLGVVDGVYKTFAPALGFSAAPARALSIAFVAHITQLLCASACVIGAAVTRSGGPAGASPKEFQHPRVDPSVRRQDVA
jgi:hypothetical protein